MIINTTNATNTTTATTTTTSRNYNNNNNNKNDICNDVSGSTDSSACVILPSSRACFD